MGTLLLKMALELTLGICIKLFCDNGRIHWRDFVNDFLFWLPGRRQQQGDGLLREVDATLLSTPTPDDEAQPALAAK